MSDTHKNYLFDLGYYLKERVQEARRERDAAPAGSAEREFKSGRLLGFNEVISMVQSTAEGFGIPLSDLRLDDIDPNGDLL